MQQEVDAISASWMMHYQKTQYEGEWSALPLRSVGGAIDNVLVENHTPVPFADTDLMEFCPYLKEVTETIQCPKNAIRLLKMEPGSVVKEHTDRDFNFENGEARIHIPIYTHPLVEFYLDGERMVLAEGDCWYMNFNLPHRLANPSPIRRIHLVIDCLVNDWLREVFDSPACPVKSVIPAPELYSVADKRQIISSLRALNTPTSLQMAESMESEIAAAGAGGPTDMA